MNNYLKFDFIKNSYYPNARNGSAHWLVKNRYLYMFGGSENDTVYDDFRYYDLKDNTWYKIEFDEEELTPSARFGSIFFNYVDKDKNEYLYLMSGFNDSNQSLIDIWIYNLKTKKWSNKNEDIPIELKLGAYSSYWCHNKKLYIFGGIDLNNHGISLNVINNLIIYDIEKNSVEIIDCNDNVFPDERFNSNFWKADIDDITYLYLLNGMNFNKNNKTYQLNDFWRFNTKDLTWEKLSSLPQNFDNRNSSLIWKNNQNFIYIFSGINSENDILDSVWIYDIYNNEFIYDHMSYDENLFRSDSCVWQLEDETVIIFGGIGCDHHYNDFMRIITKNKNKFCCLF